MFAATTRRLVLAAATVALAACGERHPAPTEPAATAPPAGDAAPASDDAAAREAAIRAKVGPPLGQLKRELKAALQGALQNEGAVGALTVCRDQAPAIAKRASGGGVAVGRVSDRPRNPDNAPRPWMKPLLARYAAAAPGDAPASQIVALDGGGYGYVEPIFIQDVCTTCHGATIAPAVEAKLTELYPDDKARGYQPGDFRGLFWAEVAPDAL